MYKIPTAKEKMEYIGAISILGKNLCSIEKENVLLESNKNQFLKAACSKAPKALRKMYTIVNVECGKNV